jgi:hypothetical protein
MLCMFWFYVVKYLFLFIVFSSLGKKREIIFLFIFVHVDIRKQKKENLS